MADSFIHPQALCETVDIGKGSSIWAFARVQRGVRIGRECRVGGHAIVSEGAVIGDRASIQSGAQIGAGALLEEDVFIGPNAVVKQDRRGAGLSQGAQTVVQAGATIGANATVLAGLTIGTGARVVAGTVVSRSVAAYSIVAGNPAQVIGEVPEAERAVSMRSQSKARVCSTSLPRVTLHFMHEVDDLRGNLSIGELGRDVPFDVKRYFLVYGVPNMEVRGEHAHLACHQFLIAVKGSLHVVADDGHRREEFVLDRPGLGLHLPPMTWGIQYRYSTDAVLLVLASDHYDPADYIREYERFIALVAEQGGT